MVFTKASVLAPVEAVFDASPMVAHEAYPSRGGMGVIEAITDVVALFIEGLTVTESKMVEAQSAPCMGEVDFQGLDGRYPDAPGFEASVSLLEDVKKGEAAVRLARRALMVGWLPLTWRR